MAVVRKTVAGAALEGVVESPEDDVGLLSDADEGFLQWLAVNYRMGNFSKVSGFINMQGNVAF